MSKARTEAYHLDREWCKGCGICITFCPKQVLEMDPHDKAVPARLEDCIACRLCEMICPDLAIDVKIAKP